MRLPCSSPSPRPGPRAGAPTGTVALTRRPAALAASSCPPSLAGYFSSDPSKFWPADAKNPLTPAPCVYTYPAPRPWAWRLNHHVTYTYPAEHHHHRFGNRATFTQPVIFTLTLQLDIYTTTNTKASKTTKSFTLTRHRRAHRRKTNSRPTNSPYAANTCSDFDHPFGDQPEPRLAGCDIPAHRYGQRSERSNDEWSHSDVVCNG